MSVVLHTSVGDLQFVLHVDACPCSSFNFLALCASGYYDNSIFHRNIRTFIVQGGDPTGTGKGGESVFTRYRHQQGTASTSGSASKYFQDEGFGVTTHSKRGVLSMAHRGSKANTNASQFFITYDAQRSFDGVYTAFGEVSSGFEVLAAIEALGTALQPGDAVAAEQQHIVRILGTTVLSNPFADGSKPFDPRKVV